VLKLCFVFFLVTLPISSTQLTTAEELTEILLTWELGLKISRQGLAISRTEVAGLKAELTAYENTERMLREESKGLRADSKKLRLDLTSVRGQKTSLQTSFDDYKERVKTEVKKEIRAQKVKRVVWSIVAALSGLALGAGLSQIF